MDTLVSSLDNGITDSLLALIDDYYPEDTVLARLHDNGPLSDTVLIKALQTPDALSDSALYVVLFENSPYSERVLDSLNSRDPELGEQWRNGLDTVQSLNPPYRTLTGLTKELDYYKHDKVLIINHYVRRLTSQDSVAKAIKVLENEGGYEDLQTVFGTYIEMAETDSAEAKLEQIQNMDEAESDWLEISEISLNLASEGKTWYDMDAEQEEAIRGIAEEEGYSLAKIQAQNVLHQVFRDTFPDYVDDEEFYLRTNEDNSEILSINTKANELLISPNPATDQVVIKLKPQINDVCRVEIRDITGRTILSENILSSVGEIRITVDQLDQGIYLVNVIGQENEMKSGKFVIVR